MRLAYPLTAVLVAVMAASACDRTPDPAAVEAAKAESPAPVTAPAETPAPVAGQPGGLAIEGDGLRMFSPSGSAREIPFGTPQDTTIGIVVGYLGARETPTASTNEECGEGPMQFAQYANGLQLAFQDGKFAGWFLDKPGLTTVDGVGVGATRSALAEARTVEVDPESTLGVEFTAGDVGGFLTDAGAAGRVESLYAGMTCFFR